MFAMTTGSRSGRGWSSFRSSLSAHSFQSAKSLSTLACALTSMGHVSLRSTSCPLAVTKVVCYGHVHPNCLKYMLMAPVRPLTLLHNGIRPTSRCCRLHALCSSAYRIPCRPLCMRLALAILLLIAPYLLLNLTLGILFLILASRLRHNSK